MSTAYIKNLIDYNGNIIYPQTKASAVYDDNGNLLSNTINNKVDKEDGKVLSSNDYTNEEKTKVSNLPANTNTELANKAPAYTYGTEDMTAGTSSLETGKLYFVYEE